MELVNRYEMSVSQKTTDMTPLSESQSRSFIIHSLLLSLHQE